ncbi:hypothetical protein D9M70_560640 [compost metagenome]
MAVATHGQAVVAADQPAVLDEPQGQRRTTVRAEVFQCCHAAFGTTVEDHLLAADLPSQGFSGDFIGGAGNVPGVLRKHQAILVLWLLLDPMVRFEGKGCQPACRGSIKK